MKNLVIVVMVVCVSIFFAVDALAFDFKELNISGTEEGKFFAFKDDTEEDSKLYRAESKLKLNMDYAFTDKISAVVVPEFYYDTDNLSSDVMDSLREKNERRYMGNLEEAYVVYSADQYDISLGKRIYNWGMADFYKPLDNINSYDLIDVADLRKLGIFSASFNYTWPETSINVVVVPFFTPSRMPENDSRWAVSSTDSNDALITGGQFNVNASLAQTNAFLANLDIDSVLASALQPRDLPPKQFRNMQGAIRLKTTKRGTDFSLSYYDGFDNVPVIKKRVTATEAHFIPTYNKMKEIGGAFSTTRDQLEVHAEMAFHATDGQQDDDYFEYIFGGSYTWDSSQIHHFEETKLFLEYAGESVANYKSNDDYITYAGYKRPFPNSLLGRLMLKINENNTIDLGCSYNFDDDDSYLRPQFTHKINESLKLILGLDIFSGKSDTFFGKWDRNDRLFTLLTYSF